MARPTRAQETPFNLVLVGLLPCSDPLRTAPQEVTNEQPQVEGCRACDEYVSQ
jgi:hypothetical protein